MSSIGFANYIGFDVTIAITSGATSQTIQVGSKKSNYQRVVNFDQPVTTVSLDIKTGDVSSVFQAVAKFGNLNVGAITYVALYASNNNPQTFSGATYSALPSPKTVNCWSGATCAQLVTPTESTNWTFLTPGTPDTLLYVQCSTQNYLTTSKCVNGNAGYNCVSNIPSSPVNVTVVTQTDDPPGPTAEGGDYFDKFMSALGNFFKYFIIFVAVIFVIILIAVIIFIIIKQKK
jgi:hypothetical protein